MCPEWDCSGCRKRLSYDVETAERLLEKTTLYTANRVADAFVCPKCGSLLNPYLDEI